MSDFYKGLNLNNLGATMQMSTAQTASNLLAAGQYAVWALTQPAYITVSGVGSSLFTAQTGYPVINGLAPTMVNIGVNNQIGAISTSSGIVAFQLVG